ncbi:MAG: hypothetical protein AAGJ54_09660 [Planctomycetota bacterium]
MRHPARTTTVTATIMLAAGSAFAQTAPQPSDPSNFSLVLNIGDDPNAPVPLDGPSVGGGSGTLSLSNLNGTLLTSDSQLNLYRGTIVNNGATPFAIGPSDGSGANVEVNLFNGSIQPDVSAFAGSTVNVFGGFVGFRFTLDAGATLNLDGGTLGNFVAGGVIARAGSTLNAYSGNLNANVERGSGVNIFGGNININGISAVVSGGTLSAINMSHLELRGDEFRFNGQAISSFPTGQLDSNSGILSGTLADGTVFIIAGAAGDRLRDATLVTQTLNAADTTPRTITSGVESKGLRPGQTLIVHDSASLSSDFAVVDSTLNLEGGTAGDRLQAAYSMINLAGTVGDSFHAFSGTTVNVTDGSIGRSAQADVNTTVNVLGGSIGSRFTAAGEVRIDGGSIADNFLATGTVDLISGSIGSSMRASGDFTVSGGTVSSLTIGGTGTTTVLDGAIGSAFLSENAQMNIQGGTTGRVTSFGVLDLTGGSILTTYSGASASTLNIRGGKIGGAITTENGANVNIFGTEFFIDGIKLELGDLDFDESLSFDSIDDFILTAVLLDGSTFTLDVTNGSINDVAGFTINRVPAPAVTAPLAGLLVLGRRRRRETHQTTLIH